MRWPLALFVLALPISAMSAPLSLSELDQMAGVVECRLVCESAGAASLQACVDSCPPADVTWEKSGDLRLDARDRHLATLEYWDEASLAYVCYEMRPHPSGSGTVQVVVPEPLCGACADSHSAEECLDADADGLAAWQEDALGTSDATANSLSFCDGGWDCGFTTSCQFIAAIANQTCLARQCSGPCTAFHLEEVSRNNQELILHVHYDYSPVPATVLDLKIRYDRNVLTLLDARPLPLLRDRNKQVTSSHVANGTLRLVVVDSLSVVPIPTGPIIELVFQRKSPLQTSVSFETDNFAQAHSMAPDQGATAQDELRNDALWGSPVGVAAADPIGPRLLLHYSFDDPARPIAYADVPSTATLCAAMSACALESDANTRAKIEHKLGVLQAGAVAGGHTIEGVSAEGIYLAGTSDHLRLPVTLTLPATTVAQDFSLSAWFYAEGNSRDEADTSPQLLFSHNAHSEQTAFGIQVVPAGPDFVQLEAFEGHYATGAIRTPIVQALPLRRWTHLGVSFDADTGAAELYLDGEAVRQLALVAGSGSVRCPQLAAGDLLLHEEGDILGGRAPEFVYLGAAQPSGLFAIERMDTNGLARERVLAAPDSSFIDPDYSPVVDKLVYSSNAGGAFEIWIADPNGAVDSRRQVTVGFGDTARGIMARRPRWAPDGSAIVFESNVYNIAAIDNLDVTYQLYLVQFDASQGTVAVPLASGGFAAQLDYGTRVADGTIDDYRLTRGDRHHFGVWWLAGQSDSSRGDVLFTSSDDLFEARRVERLTIPNNINDAQAAPLALFDPFDEVEVVSAYSRSVPGSPPTEETKALVKRGRVAYETGTADSGQFAWSATEATAIDVAVSHEPSGYDPMCWDANRNRTPDPDEDKSGDLLVDVADCYPYEVRNLYLAYDPDVVLPETALSMPGAALAPAATDKLLQLKEMFAPGQAFVRVEVRSPFNNTPLPAGAEIAQLVFTRVAAGDPGFVLRSRVAHDELYIKDLNTSDPPQSFSAAPLDQVAAAAFSPDGGALVLAGVSDAAPILLRTAVAGGAVRIASETLKPHGLSWVRQERFYACNWVGGYREPFTGMISAAFRGGVDELKIYSYARAPEAFRSDAQRGAERLDQEDRRTVPSRLPAFCSADLECPAYHLCQGNACAMVACQPDDPYGCPRGLCTLRPVGVEQESPGFDWVCSAECSLDTECFTKRCLNGPCRFCDARTFSCTECRAKIEDYGSFQISTSEGCPDRNSFTCDEGSCLTECYAFDDAATTYLCDPALEYCSRGRCVLFDWSWSDVAPASFSGLDEVRYEGLAYSTAIPELYPIEIQAYGVEDNGRSPVILVEASAPEVYDGWFTLGAVTVKNRYSSDAAAHPYFLSTPYRLTAMRLRLVVTPYDNLNAAATGLLGKDKDFCRADAEAWAVLHNTPADYSPCTWRAPGSLATNGYPVGIPEYASRAACAAAGMPGCTVENDPLRKYLLAGRPAVAITEVKVDGTSYRNGITTNLVCSYEGSAEPFAATGRRKKLVFGALASEQSNERNRFCASNDCNAPALQGLIDVVPVTGKAWALLNCDFADINDPASAAGVTITGINIVRPMVSGRITETANACLVATGTAALPRTELCYEFMADAGLDPFSDEMQLYHTLEFSMFTSFGYDGQP